MSGRAAKEETFLRFIGEAETHKQRKATIETASRAQILALAEVVLNMLKGNIPILDNHVKSLARYKKDLRILGSRAKIGWKERKQAALNCVRIIGTIIKNLYRKS